MNQRKQSRQIILLGASVFLFAGFLLAQNDQSTESGNVTGESQAGVNITEQEPTRDESALSSDRATSTKPITAEKKYKALMAALTIFALAIFVGFEIITKVPQKLHTPLMSGSNAISGITIVGAILVSAKCAENSLALMLVVLAIAMAMINVVGGFGVTHRMLSMFIKRKKKPAA